MAGDGSERQTAVEVARRSGPPLKEHQEDDAAEVYARAAQNWAKHQAERDALINQVADIAYRLRCSDGKVDELETRTNQLLSENETLRAERDGERAEKFALESILSVFKSALDNFDLQAVSAKVARRQRKAITPPADQKSEEGK